VNNVGFDIDGVLADFNRALAIDLGYSPVHAHPDRWDWPHTVATDPIVDRVWNHITEHAAWWYVHVKPYAEATTRDFLRHLSKIGESANLYFITSRPQVTGMKYYTEQWIAKYLGVSNPTVILAQDKGDVAAGIGITHFVDDNTDNCKSVADGTHGLCKTFILHRPYNAEFKYSDVKRIHTLTEFTDAVLRPNHAMAGAEGSIFPAPATGGCHLR
jgi:hypothetical protein